MRRAWLVMALCGCSVGADYGGTHYRCGDGRCPTGFQCVAGACQLLTDGAPSDGPGSDGPGSDAASGSDGGRDAASPDGGIDVCGKAPLLADNFDDGVRASDWDFSGNDPGVTVAETGGHLVITPAASDASAAYGWYETQRTYDLTESRVYVELVTAPSAAGSAQATLEAIAGSGMRVQIAVSGGRIGFEKQVGGTYTDVANLAYDAVQDRWWQLRESAGQTYWETSADGATWTTRASAPDPVPLGAVHIQLAAGAEGAVASPGQAVFDNLNGGVPSGHWCKTSTLTDAFTSVSAAVWGRGYTSGGCQTTTSGGVLVMTPANNTISACALISSASFDLGASSLAVEVPQVTRTMNDALTELSVQRDDGSYLDMTERSGVLQFNRHLAAGGATLIGSLPYDAAAHRWWRLREAGGTVFYETSADGLAWVSRASVVPGFPLDVLDVQLRTATEAAIPAPGSAHYDNLNLAP